MLSAMIGMPTARSSSAAVLISPPMIEPARTSRRARGRSATARTAAAISASPTSAIVSTEIRSPRRLWRSASLTAPSATCATWAPPPTTMIRLPKMVPSSRVSCTSTTGSTPRRASSAPSSDKPSTSSSISARGGGPGVRRTTLRVRIRPPASATLEATAGMAFGSSARSMRTAAIESAWGRGIPFDLGSGISRGRRDRLPRAAGRRPRSSQGRSRRSGRAPRRRGSTRRTRRAWRRVRRREHQRPVRVLGHADDPGDVHASLGEGGRDAREGAGAIIETDREPDGQWAPPAKGWYRAGLARTG